MTKGRPKIEVTKELCDKAEQYASQGLTMEQIADALGMSKSSLFEKQKDNLDLMESIKRGKAKGIVTITNALFEKAKDGDNTAMIFYLKNRAGWKDKIETEHTGEGLKVDVKVPDHFQRIMEELDKLAEHKSTKDDRVLQ
jgi:transcriptional regulator with XRE-family HTH domain